MSKDNLHVVSDKRKFLTRLDIFVDETEFCDGKIKYFRLFYSGTIEQCPECEHWNATAHNHGDDVIEEWIQLCHCCGYLGDLEL